MPSRTTVWLIAIALSVAILLVYEALRPAADRAKVQQQASALGSSGERSSTTPSADPLGPAQFVRLTLAGVRVELMGALIAGIVVAFLLLRDRAADPSPYNIYLFALAIIALAGILSLANQLSWQLSLLSLPHHYALAATVAFFLYASTLPLSNFAGSVGLLRSGARHVKSRTVMAVIVVFGIAIVSASLTYRNKSAGAETFALWFHSQARRDLPIMTPNDGVLLVKFNDYQCPPCKRGHVEYRDLLDRLAREYPSKLRVVSLDYPLNTKCNPYVRSDVRPAACDAAVAARVAKNRGKLAQFEDWLWDHQAELSAASIRKELLRVTGVTDAEFESMYAQIETDIKKDIDLGRQLKIPGTPTYFLNGVRLPLIAVKDLEYALRTELSKSPSNQVENVR